MLIWAGLAMASAAYAGQNSTFIQGPALVESTAQITASGTVAHLSASSDTNLGVVGAVAQTVQMPDATTLKVGRRFSVYNASASGVSVQDAQGGALASVLAGSWGSYLLQDNTTVAGSWLRSATAGGSGGGVVAAVPRVVNTVSSNFTMSTLLVDNIVNVNTAGGSVTVTLPDAVASGGFCVDAKNLGNNAVAVVASGGQTVDGAVSSTLTVQYQSVRICAVGGSWFNY